MNLPTKPEDMFTRIEGTVAVIVTKKGIRQPLPLFEFDDSVYFAWQGGYVRITVPDPFRSTDTRTAFRTDHPDLWASHIIGNGVVAKRSTRNGQSYLTPAFAGQRVAAA